MDQLRSSSLNLADVTGLIENAGNLQPCLQTLAGQTARQLRADHCSILLFADTLREGTSLRVFAHYGACLPIAIEDIDSDQPNCAGDFISTPILLCERTIGVIHVTLPCQKLTFDERDRAMLNLFAQQVSQSIHIYHLQSLAKSRFITMAVGQAIEENELLPAPTFPHPPKLAKIVAKAFFKELTEGGFSPHEVIEIATEVLSLLEKTIHKHKQRLDTHRD